MDKLPSLPPTRPGLNLNKELALYHFADLSLQFPGVISSRLFTDIMERLISPDIFTPELSAFQAFDELEYLFKDKDSGRKRYLCDRRDALEWVHSWWEGAQLAGLTPAPERPPFVPPKPVALEDYLGLSDKKGLASALVQLSILATSRRTLTTRPGRTSTSPPRSLANLRGAQPSWRLLGSWSPSGYAFRTFHLKAKARRSSVLASSPIEDWCPSWLGAGLPKSSQNGISKSHSADLRKDLGKFLINSWVFWLCHFGTGIISLQAAVAHHLLLLKLRSEHSLEIMVQYSAHLQTHILQELRTSDIPSLDHAISVLNDKLLSRLLLKQRPLREPTLRDDEAGAPRNRLWQKEGLQPLPRPPLLSQRAPAKAAPPARGLRRRPLKKTGPTSGSRSASSMTLRRASPAAIKPPV